MIHPMLGHLHLATDADPAALVPLDPLGVGMAQEVGELSPYLVDSIPKDNDGPVVCRGPLGAGKRATSSGSSRVGEVWLAPFNPKAVLHIRHIARATVEHFKLLLRGIRSFISGPSGPVTL